MTDPAIEASDLGLAYRVAHHQGSTVKEYLVRLMQRHVQYERKWGVQHVSFALQRGETLGVVGPNGAGKSTLMKLIARVLEPTEGRIVVRGRVAPLIELGAGFSPELTGQENVVLYGTILGHSPALMRSLAPGIAAWAELIDELDVPLREYSSGMAARLAFAVATAVLPDILVVDEALSVGDEVFRARSRARMEQLTAHGAAMVLVSHDLEVIRERCDRALYLSQGHPVALGPTDEVVDQYIATSHREHVA